MGEEERQILGGTQAWGNGCAGVAGGKLRMAEWT